MIWRTWALLALCGLVASGCATPTIVNPTWAELPAPDDMADAYPGFAGIAGLPGQASLGCIGLADGRLANCEVVWEAPEGLGFGQAALQVAPRFRLSPRTVDGEAAKSRVRFNVRFLLPEIEIESAPPYEGPAPGVDRLALARPLAEKMMDSAWGAEEEFELDVDEDRQATVERIIAEADAEFEREQVGALALALARVLTPAQIESMNARQMPDEPLPPIEDLYAAGAAEGFEISERYTERVRTKYCALYACDPKWTGQRPRDLGYNQPGVEPDT